MAEGKYCNECKELLPFTEFKHQHNTRDGYSVRCLPCIRKGKILREIADIGDIPRLCTSCGMTKQPEFFYGAQFKCKECIRHDREAKKLTKAAKVPKKQGRGICTIMLENGKTIYKTNKKGW